MSGKKKPAKDTPSYYGERIRAFKDKFGIEVSPWVAVSMTCRVCGTLIVPLRKGLYSCERPLCGPLIPRSALLERLMREGRMGDDIPAMLFLNDIDAIVKAQKLS